MKNTICALVLIFALLFNINPAFSKTKNDIKQRPSVKELRESGIRTYSTNDKLRVMKAVLNVLQDNYYFINQTDSKIGFVHAAKEVDTQDPYTDIKATFGCSKMWTGIKRYSSSKEEANINVTTKDNTTSVRVHIRTKVLNMYDVEIRIKEMVDKNYYDEFFNKLDKELEFDKIVPVKRVETIETTNNSLNKETKPETKKKKNK